MLGTTAAFANTPTWVYSKSVRYKQQQDRNELQQCYQIGPGLTFFFFSNFFFSRVVNIRFSSCSWEVVPKSLAQIPKCCYHLCMPRGEVAPQELRGKHWANATVWHSCNRTTAATANPCLPCPCVTHRLPAALPVTCALLVHTRTHFQWRLHLYHLAHTPGVWGTLYTGLGDERAAVN